MPAALRPRPRRTPESPASVKNKHQGWLHALEVPHEATANFFGGLGRWISTRQTVSLLATALVICSLLSPAIILTFSTSGSPFDLSSSAITRRGRGELVWELEGMRRQGLIASEEEVCWDRIEQYYEKTGRSGGGRRIRVEQVLVSVTGSRGLAGSRGTISKGVLHRAWKVEKELERRLLDGEIRGNRCLAVEGGECATLSPAGWWKSEDALLRDEDVHRTLSGSLARTFTTIPLTLSEAFVGVGKDRQGTVKSAQSLVITFFLEDEPDLLSLPAPGGPANFTLAGEAVRDEAKEAWRRAVKDVMDHKGWSGESKASPKDPLGLTSESRLPTRHVLLKFLPHLTVDAHPRRLENIIYAIGYLLVLLYVSRYIRKLRAHSKMGLLVTGIVELAASGIMSVSICWLLGWSLSLVPWNLLAFLVLTSGLDNMILVLRAIATTDMKLPVPQRMSQGLRSVGVEMTILLLVEEVMAAALLWFVEINVMREWIRFGAVVLVVDYFLELTFFSTVLSIDIQRLELADLLAQNSSPAYQAVPTSASSAKAIDAADSIWSIRSVGKAAWRTLRDRPAKTSTVAFLWFINLSLWAFYGSEHYLPAVCSQAALSSDRPFLAPSLSPAISRSLRLGRTSDPASSSHLEVPLGSGSAFWQLINPTNVTSVQVYLEPTVSVQFFDDEALAAPESIDLLHATTDVPSFAKKAMLVLLPIAIVMGLLYLLLLYLLKDAELLEAHHSSEERLGGPAARRKRQEDSKRRPEAGAELVPRAKRRHGGDVELIASGGGATASWAGLEGKVHVEVQSETGERDPSSYALDIPLGAEPTSLTSLAIDGEGRFCAAATSKGRLLVWSLERGGALLDFGSTSPTSAILSLLATPRTEAKSKTVELPGGTPAPPVSRNKVEEEKAAHPAAFFTLHRDGRVVRWDCTVCRANVVKPVADEQQVEVASKQWLIPGVKPDEQPLLALADKSGRLSLFPLQQNDAAAPPPSRLELGSLATASAAGSFPLLSATDSAPADEAILVSGTASGKLSLHVLSSSTRAVPVADLGSAIRQIRLVSSPNRPFCPSCSDPIVDGLTVLAATRSTLKIFRLFTPPTPSSLEPCACNTSDPTIVPRSRSSSMGILGSPVMSRSLSSGVSRRFSPRKKPVTPTRPLQLPPSALGDSPSRPRLHSRSGNGSYSSQSSSSGTSTPAAEPSQPAFSPISAPMPPPAHTLPSPATSPDASPPPMTLPLPPAFLDPLAPLTSTSTESTSPFDHLRVVEVASITIDERSGWEVIGGKVVGLRRARKSEGGRGWEVWSVGLGKEDAAFDEGFEEGVTDLAELLEAAKESDEAVPEEAKPTLASVPPLRPNSPSSLRRRTHSPSDPVPPAPSSTSSSRLSRPSSASSSTSSAVRFSAETVDLPFSRARPVVSALGGTAAAIGLGNQVVLLQAAKQGGLSWQQNGFLGL